MRESFLRLVLPVFLIGLLITGCKEERNFEIGQCIVPGADKQPTKIVKVVAVDERSYSVFTHFLSGGNLVLAEDYQSIPRSETNKNFVVIECPNADSRFSPDKYLNKKEGSH